MNEESLRQAICDAGRRLFELGLVGACEGNISARLSEDRLLSTPSGVCKGTLRPEDLTIIDLLGNPIDGAAPSSEIKMHLRIYEHRPDCQAVVHAHPITATAFTLTGKTIPENVMPEAAVVLGPVALVQFGMPGTDEVPDGLEPFLPDFKTFLLSHHGAVVMGKDVPDALCRMETLERVAQVCLTARMLGMTKPMPDDAYEVMVTQHLHGRL